MSRPSLLPLIKWSGGKRSEIPFLKPAYPSSFDRVIEPFSGGAAVSLDSNSDHTILNDVSAGLVDFYRTIQDPAQRTLFLIALSLVDQVRKSISNKVALLSEGQLKNIFLNPKTDPWIVQHVQTWCAMMPLTFQTKLKLDFEKNLTSKLSTRVPNLEKKHNIVFDHAKRLEHLETALQAGVYTLLRRVYNSELTDTSAWSTVAWYVVRSLCYSGMFRYGKNGAFNVPYGGIAYNSRDFQTSIAQIKNPDMIDFWTRTTIHQCDFDALFAQYNGFTSNDFIFVDPPYDSAFSQYNAEGDFTAQDQQRLANTLKSCQAKWMLVIKNTPFILSLYQDANLYRGVFNKNYQVNFRNRHDRGVEHLVVTNYPIPPSVTSIKSI